MRPFVAFLATFAACADTPSEKPGRDTGAPTDTDPADTDPADTDTSIDTDTAADTDTALDTDTAADTDTAVDTGTAAPVELNVADAVKVHAVTRMADLGRIVRVADVDGDGQDDVVAATPQANGSTGGALTLPGPLTSSGVAEDIGRLVRGSRYGAGLGWSVSVGDLDGDGVDDIGLGLPEGTPDGMVIVYGPHVGDVADDEAGLALLGGPGAMAGHGGAFGDVSGDGVLDAVVGAYNTDVGTGTVYVRHGPVTGDVDLPADADATLLGERRNLYAGRTVSAAGDLDGDGIRDLVVGCLGSMGPAFSGGAYVVHGPIAGALSLADADGRYTGESADARAGSVIDAGDTDGDGLDDLVVTANDSTFADNGGAVFVVFGPAAADTDLSAAELILRGDRRNQFNGSVAAADVDGDGEAELFVGAAGDNAAARFIGAVYGFYDPAPGEYAFSDSDLVVNAEARGGQLGTGVAVGEVDGDVGFELVVGAPTDATGAENGGAVYVVDLP